MQPTLPDPALRILSVTAVAFGIVPAGDGGGAAPSPTIAAAAPRAGRREERIGGDLVLRIRRRWRRPDGTSTAKAVASGATPEAAVGRG